MLRGLKLTYKGHQVVFTSFELLREVIKLFQNEHIRLNSSKPKIRRLVKKSAFEPSKFNTLQNSEDWIKLGLSLQQGKVSSASIITGYRVGGRHIAFINPSDRYAIDYGEYISLNDIISEQLKNNEYFQKLVQEAKKDTNAAQKLYLQIALGLYVIQQIDEDLVGQGKTSAIKPESDAITDATKSKDKEKLAYITLYKLIYEYYKSLNIPINDIDVAKQIREILNGAQELKIVKCNALPVLSGALFAAELSRNPTSFLSGLILLDFIEAGITYGKTGKLYTWEKILWDPSVIQLKISGIETLSEDDKEIADRRGGKHPMTHKGSFSREFSTVKDKNYIGEPWKLDKELLEVHGALMPPISDIRDNTKPLATARKREGSLLIRWLFHIINQGIIEGDNNETSQVEITKDLTGSAHNAFNDEAIKKEILDNILVPLMTDRMETFDSMLESYSTYDSLLKKSAPDTVTPAAAEKLPTTQMPAIGNTIQTSFSNAHQLFAKISNIRDHAENALKNNDFNTALKMFSSLTQIQSKNPNWYYKLGLTHYGLKKYHEAIYNYNMCFAFTMSPALEKQVESEINKTRNEIETNLSLKNEGVKNSM